MAYTVQKLYDRVLEGTDKIGSDLFTLPDVMSRVETAAYDFIGETVKYIENTQEIRDDLLPLYKPFTITLIEDPNDANYKVAPVPTDYHHLMQIKVVNESKPVRKTRVIRHGQEEIFEINPNKKATEEYPTVVLYKDYFRIISPGTPVSVTGFYIKKPTFPTLDENSDLDTEIAVDLPDHSTEKLIKTVITDWLISTGDPRAPMQHQERELYRNR